MSKKGYLDQMSTDEFVLLPDDFPDFTSIGGDEFYPYYEINYWFSKHPMPNRCFKENVMITALTLEEIQFIIDSLDGGGGLSDKIATELSNQSLYQAITPEAKDTYTIVYSKDGKYYYIEEFAGKVGQWHPTHPEQGDEILPFVFWKVKVGEKREIPKDSGVVESYISKITS